DPRADDHSSAAGGNAMTKVLGEQSIIRRQLRLQVPHGAVARVDVDGALLFPALSAKRVEGSTNDQCVVAERDAGAKLVELKSISGKQVRLLRPRTAAADVNMHRACTASPVKEAVEVERRTDGDRVAVDGDAVSKAFLRKGLNEASLLNPAAR